MFMDRAGLKSEWVGGEKRKLGEFGLDFLDS
jgi:hypothetical protein